MKYLQVSVIFFFCLSVISCGGGGGGNTPPPPPPPPQNNVPVANAGVDFSVDENSAAMLNGDQSTDADGDTLSYSWTQTSGTAVPLSDNTSQSPEFQAPELLADETLIFQLEVSDGSDTNSDTVEVTITADNDLPTADAGNDITIDEDENGTLNGSASIDPENQALTYTWLQVSGPSITLSDPNSVQPTFTTGNYLADSEAEFQLTVNDGENNSNVDNVLITIVADNDTPTAEAGDDISTLVNEFVNLDCAGSADPENETITYSWRQISGPQVTLSGPTRCSPQLLVPKAADRLVFGLTVNDGVNDSIEDQVAVDSRYYSGNAAPLYGNPALIEQSVVINQSFTTARLYSNDEYLFIRRVDDDFLTQGIDIISIQDPLNPTVIGTIIDEAPRSMVVVGDLVYYTHGFGMSIASIADPTAPVVLDSFAFNGDGATSIAVNGDAVYCTDADGNFLILNATDPNNILAFEAFPIDPNIDGDQGRGMVYQDGYAYVVYSSNSSGLFLAAININILNPGVASKTDLLATLIFQIPIVADGDQLIIGANSQIFSVDISNPLIPVRNNVSYRQVVDVQGFDLDATNDRLYVANNGSGVVVLDVSDLSDIRPLGIHPMDSFIDGVAKIGNYIYASESISRDEGKLIHILNDTTNTFNLAVSSRLNIPGISFNKMAVAGQHVFTLSNGAPTGPSIRSIDFSDLTAPIVRDTALLPEQTVDIARFGDKLAATQNSGGFSRLNLFDISDPNVLLPGDNISNVDGTETWGQVTLDNSTAFVSKSSNPRGSFIGVEAFDISDVDNISSISDYAAPNVSHPFTPPIALAGATLYGADQIIDVADPANPDPLAQFRLGSQVPARAFTESRIVGDRMFVTTFFGIDVYDISTPTNPQLVTQSDTIITPQDLTIVGDYVVVEERANGIQVLDFSDGVNLEFSGQINTYSHPLFAVDNGLHQFLSTLDTLGQYALAMDAESIIAINPSNPITHSNFGVVSGNAQLGYQLSWEGATYPVDNVSCTVSAGECFLDFVEPGGNTAALRWQLPNGAAGEYEIVFTIGDLTYYFTAADRIVVE